MSEKQLNIPRQISNTLNSVNKTISENKELKINVNSNIVLEKDDTLNLPSISNIFNYVDMRGAADSFALKKKYHDEKLLNQITSKNIDIREEIIFLERLRYETYGSKPFKGIIKNIGSGIRYRKNNPTKVVVTWPKKTFLGWANGLSGYPNNKTIDDPKEASKKIPNSVL